ncbi:hypothetical protein GCM10025854_21420 [Tetragenococcus muriaticus]|nr:hypothetical protein GCM10025854_21420 [Tetragenococcus muriaticus]
MLGSSTVKKNTDLSYIGNVGVREGLTSKQKVVTRVFVLLLASAGKRTFLLYKDGQRHGK